MTKRALVLARVAALASSALALVGACNPLLGIEDVVVVDEDTGASSAHDAAAEAKPSDASVADRADRVEPAEDAALDADVAPPPQPHPSCVKAAKDRAQMTLAFSEAVTTKPIEVTVTDTAQGFTNVNITLCTPESPTEIVVDEATVVSGSAPFRWRFDAGTLPRGVTQIGFRADPGTTTLYENARLEVR